MKKRKSHHIRWGGDMEATEILKGGNSSYGGSSNGSAGSSVKKPDGTVINVSANQSNSFWGGTPNKGDFDCQVYTHVYLNVPSGSTVSYTASANQRTGSNVIGVL